MLKPPLSLEARSRVLCWSNPTGLGSQLYGFDLIEIVFSRSADYQIINKQCNHPPYRFQPVLDLLTYELLIKSIYTSHFSNRNKIFIVPLPQK